MAWQYQPIPILFTQRVFDFSYLSSLGLARLVTDLPVDLYRPISGLLLFNLQA